MVLTSVLMGYSVHLGRKMVYEQGTGVVPMKEIILQEESGEHHHHHGEEENDHNADNHGFLELLHDE